MVDAGWTPLGTGGSVDIAKRLISMFKFIKDIFETPDKTQSTQNNAQTLHVFVVSGATKDVISQEKDPNLSGLYGPRHLFLDPGHCPLFGDSKSAFTGHYAYSDKLRLLDTEYSA